MDALGNKLKKNKFYGYTQFRAGTQRIVIGKLKDIIDIENSNFKTVKLQNVYEKYLVDRRFDSGWSKRNYTRTLNSYQLFEIPKEEYERIANLFKF